jgi:osmoprotectant transport system ATP-binding protein
VEFGVIQFESVGKTFRDGTSAVVDLDLVAPSGKITVIVGPSGCGKTTTLRMVNRMLEPTKGRILWDGTPIKSRRKTTLRRQMGYVIQSGGLFPHRTVVDNIGTVPGLLGWNKQKTRSRSMELLDNVGLDRKLASRYPAQLSGGQQQRVGVARALAADPLVLLMDEPFSAVDPVVRAELHEFFLGLQRELSKTIILITHDIDEAIKLGDQVAIMRVGGKLAQAGTPQEVLERPADAFVEGFVGRDRGYRSLSFLPAADLPLDPVAAVRDPATASPEYASLVIDAAAKPLGWVDPRLPDRTSALGATFNPEKDTLRTALDAALTSPVGLAVAVGSDGRYAGVVTPASILAHVAEGKVAEPGPELVDGPPIEIVEETQPEPVEEAPTDLADETVPEAAAGSSAWATQQTEGRRDDQPSEPVEETRPELVEDETRPELVGGSSVQPAQGHPEEQPRPEPVEGPGEQPAEGRPELVEEQPRPAPVEGPSEQSESPPPEPVGGQADQPQEPALEDHQRR